MNKNDSMVAEIEAIRAARAKGIRAEAGSTHATAHNTVRRHRGSADDHPCIGCGQKADQWAFQGSEHTLVDKISGCSYSLDPDDYAPMCLACHRALDKQTRSVRLTG
jgi:hypothetical protein